ncbi:Hypothetical protein D9617_69g078020 [Elsinoe fawcettii]|nr:Hypothetical protein D9617_69g078020 [Elsinoe fawcettii]
MSPVLYTFYNAKLVDLDLGKKGSTIGFIDDFTAWIAAEDVKTATEALQHQVIPHAEAWAAESGAIFEAEKTGLIHFIRPFRAKAEKRTATLYFLGQTIAPKDTIRILEVHLDYRLRMDGHTQKTLTKAMTTCHKLTNVRGLRPRQMRQFYLAVVETKID